MAREKVYEVISDNYYKYDYVVINDLGSRGSITRYKIGRYEKHPDLVNCLQEEVVKWEMDYQNKILTIVVNINYRRLEPMNKLVKALAIASGENV